MTWQGHVIADTTRALTLREATYPDVHYVPRKDVDMSLLSPSAHQTDCAFKGDCSYLTLAGSDERGVDAVWFYGQPFDAVAPINTILCSIPTWSRSN